MLSFYEFVLFLSLFPSIWGDESLIITIKQGNLRGNKYKSRNGTEYRSFLGIPYAKPPIGELRFQSPQQPDIWDGIRDATILPPKCVQKDMLYKMASSAPVEGEEDCLYLNVFSPSKVNYSSKLPVIVYIHGGAFIMGTPSIYSPDYFMDHNVILVFLQYRLGPFGFISTADTIIPGNYGMKDQVAALKWVRENIGVFGGNPELVTIFGESAGGSCVHLHLYSPLSKGLFHRAISHSGSALSFWSRSKPAAIRQKTLALGILVGCPVDSSVALLECLRKVPAKELMLAHHKFYVWDFEPTIHLTTVPESKLVEDAFIYEDPGLVPPVSSVPWITGLNSGEGAIKTARFLSGDGKRAKEMNDNYKRLIPMKLNAVDWLDYFESLEIAEAVKQFYFGKEEIGFETAENLKNMLTDGIFLYSSFEGMAKYHKNLVYFFYYDHRNAFSFTDYFGNCSITDLGVSHVDDLVSFFRMPSYGLNVTEGPDFEVSKRLIERYVSFARTGIPHIDDEAWDPFDKNEVNYLHITSTHDEMKKGLLKDRLSFWKNILSRVSYNSSPHDSRNEL